MIEINKIYNMDCLEGMKQIEDNSVDCSWTDPPYNIDYNYSEYKDNKTKEEYWCFLEEVFKDIYRVLKDGSCLFIKQYHKNQYKMVKVCLDIGFLLHNTIIWKNSSPAQPKSNYKSIYEVILVFTKGEIKYFNDKFETRKTIMPWNKDRLNNYYGKLSNLWDDIPPVYAGSIKHKEGVYKVGTNKKIHPAQHPIKLVTRSIGFTTKENEIVLDPFIGSGTTAVACKQLNRNFIGFEITEEYCVVANKRLEQGNLNGWVKQSDD